MRFSIHDDIFDEDRKKNPNERKAIKFYKARMEKLARSMFKWTSSVPNVRGDLIERYLWLDGMCLIWYHDILGWIVTKGSEKAWNINGEAVEWKPIADKPVDGIKFPDSLSIDECIPVYEWGSRHIQRRFATFLAYDMADVNETMRVQAFNQKTPLMAISGDDKTKQTLQNMIVNLADNTKVMFMNRDLGQDVKALDFNAPFNIPDLWAYKQSIFSEYMSWIGCDSQDVYQKKERKIVSEQEANNEELNYCLADQLNERLKACDIASKFGLNITVEVQRSVRPADSEMEGDPEQPDDNMENGIDETS